MSVVLVVDDDVQIARALRINLTARGYHVVTASDGAGALRAASDAKPDVIVLDLGLPDMDGTEVITTIRGWSVTPVIVLSARTDSSAKIRALDAGADDYVTKPFGMDELMARVDVIKRERVRVRDELLAMGYDVPETQANFVWLPLGDRTAAFNEHCLSHKVIVRAFAGDGARVMAGTSVS
ncbi:response regulator, partial [Kibdelosporangium lantanae]